MCILLLHASDAVKTHACCCACLDASGVASPADESFARFEQNVKHIACDRKDAEALKANLQGKGFQGK